MTDSNEIYAAFLRDYLLPEPIDAELFDTLCRAAVTRIGVPAYCRLRRCRRQDYCIGPSEPRDLPEEICGDTPIVATLPRCAARVDDASLLFFIVEWQIARLDYFGQPPPRPPEAAPPRPCLPPVDRFALDFVAAAADLSGDR